MNITFGMHLDGYQQFVRQDTIGEVVTGPEGLLQVLETHLGLAGMWAPSPVRVVQFQRCLELADDGSRFYSASFQVDSLAVAETLLNWRDEWIAAGWDGTASESDSVRLRDLAAVEVIARDLLGSGRGDRLRAATHAMALRDPGIDQVRVVDRLDDLPPVWRRILDRLPVVKKNTPQFDAVTAEAGSDLARLQHALLTHTPVSYQGDGSFFVLVAASEQTLSRSVAGVLIEPDGWGTEHTSVVSGQRAAVFDRALAEVGLPLTGQTNPTPWRPAPQVLRLALSLLWNPLDPHCLLEFLAHPVCPLRQPLRSRLARVVSQAPGIGGAEWRRVIEETRAEAVAKADGDDRAGKAMDEQIAIWLEVRRFDPADGAPVEILGEQCNRVSRWAGARADTLEPDDPQRLTFLTAQTAAMAAAAAIDELAKGDAATLTRLQLDRLIDQVTAGGSTRPDLVAECGHVHAITHPAATVETVPRVVWWDFSPPAMTPRWPWTPSELAQLRDHGAELASVDAMLQFEARGWLRPVLSARRQLVLVRDLEKIKLRALLVYGSVFGVAPRVTYNKYAPLGAP